MLALRMMLAALVLAPLGKAVPPAYTLASVVNSATGVSGDLAPNGMVSIYGTNLAYSTEAAPAGLGILPRMLAGVSVTVGGLPANLFYVSPQQINFLVPSTLISGFLSMNVVREGVAGPVLSFVLKDTAPGFFPTDTGNVIGTHTDGTLVTVDSPAARDEVVILYAAGLGRTNPDMDPGRPSTRAAPILLLSQLSLLLGGAVVDPTRILYAGVAPGFAGLYQINLRIPVTTPENPEIRAFIGPQGSPSFLKLPVHIQ